MYVEKIKKSMRITHDMLDDEIQSNIEASLLDMKRIGIEPYNIVNGEIQKNSDGENELKDLLVYKAIEFYCKWQDDFEGMGDKYELRYHDFLSALSLSGKYIEDEA